MTHADALTKHNLLLHSDPECHRPLDDLGPDPELPGCHSWACYWCRVVLSIDGLGVIRERRALTDPRD